MTNKDCYTPAEVTDEQIDRAMTAYDEFLGAEDEADYEAMRAALEAVQPVAWNGVNDAQVDAAFDAYWASGRDPNNSQWDAIKAGLIAAQRAALTTQCQVRKDGQGVEVSAALVPATRWDVVDLLRSFQSGLGSIKPDDPDDADVWDRIDRACAAMTSPSAGAVVPDELPEDAVIFGDDDDDGYRMGWNACRKAMLAAAPEVKS